MDSKGGAAERIALKLRAQRPRAQAVEPPIEPVGEATQFRPLERPAASSAC